MGKVTLSDSNDTTLFFIVKSNSRDITHDTWFDKDSGWICSCEQYYYRKNTCKHMVEAKKYYLKNFTTDEDYDSFIKLMDTDFIFRRM